MKYEKTEWVEYEKTDWVEEGSSDFAEGQSPAMSSDNLNKIETGIFNNSKHLHRVSPVLSYLAFIDGNSDVVDAAFGKNNEDYFTDVGMSLAMYAWFKGTDKTLCPFDNLCNMSTLDDMNFDVYSEIIEDSPICTLITKNTYATTKVFEYYGAEVKDRHKNSPVEEVNIVVTEEDLKYPFLLSYTVTSSSSDSWGEFYLNDILVDKAASGYDEEVKLLLSRWETYGITKPGTYIARVRAYGRTASDGNGLYYGSSRFTIHKAKQYEN